MVEKPKKITVEEFKEFLKQKGIKALKDERIITTNDELAEMEEEIQERIDDGYCRNQFEGFMQEAISPIIFRNKQVLDDICKIEFSTENIFTDDNEYDAKGIGIQTIGDFNYLGIVTGGDEEVPIYFILYVDHKNQLRGYVPTDGNVFNKKLKSAFGNHEEEDNKAARLYGFKSVYQMLETDKDLFDWGKIREDIKNRIEVVR